MRRGVWLGMVMAMGLWASSAHALSEQAELEKARAAFAAKNYRAVETRVRALIDSNEVADPYVVAQSRMYLGAALVEQGRTEEASQVFERLLLDDSQYDADPLTFSTAVLELFIDTRAQLRERLAARAVAEAKKAAERRRREEAERRLQAERLAKVERMASEEKITSRNLRLVAFVPFGVGQFQNRQPVLGAFFLGAEVALLAAGAVTVPIYRYALSRRDEVYAQGDFERKMPGYTDRAQTAQAFNLVFAGLFGLTAVAGIVQANVAFVPEFAETKKRSLPPPITLSPTAAPLLDDKSRVQGASIGLVGQF